MLHVRMVPSIDPGSIRYLVSWYTTGGFSRLCPREAYAVRHTVCSVHVRRTYGIIVCYPRDAIFRHHILFECVLWNPDDVDIVENGKL
jgi:hypothetical protein